LKEPIEVLARKYEMGVQIYLNVPPKKARMWAEKWARSMEKIEPEFKFAVAKGLMRSLRKVRERIRKCEEMVEKLRKKEEHIKRVLFSEKFLPYVLGIVEEDG